MPSLREHVKPKDRPRAVNVPREDRRLQPRSPQGLQVSRKVAMAVSLAAVVAVATLVLVAALSGPSEQRGAVLAQNVVRSDYNYPPPSTAFLEGKSFNLRRVIAQSQSPVLPSLRQVLSHAKSDRERRVREMEERHRRRDVPDPNYDQVRVQLRGHHTQGSGDAGGSPSGTPRHHRPLSPIPLRARRQHHVEKEVPLLRNEELNSRKHSLDNHQNTNSETSAFNGKKGDEYLGKTLHEMGNVSSKPVKGKTAKKLHTKESDRLPTRTLTNGTRVCETAECLEAATRISQSLDRTANPCDDFYQFACGGWINNHSVPGSGWVGTFTEAAGRLDEALLLILETPAEPSAPAPLHEIRTLYNSCMDLDKLEEIGLDPLMDLLSGQGGWPMVEEAWNPDSFSLFPALNSLRNLNVYPLISVYVNLDAFNTSRWLIYVDAGAVPIGVTIMDSISEDALAPYRTLMTTAARLMRDHVGSNITDQEINEQVQEVIDFEIRFSKIVMKAVNETTNHAWFTTVAELQEDTDGGTPNQFKWLDFLKEMFAETSIVITKDEPLLSFKGPFFKDFSNMLATTDPRTMANALGWWWVYTLQQETTGAMRNASNDYLHDFYGTSQQPSRQPHCLDMTNTNLGFALSREYVDKFLPASVKPETTEMVKDLREAFSSLLDNNTWMLPGDTEVAQEKLEAIDPFVAYPEWIMNDEQLTLGYEGLKLKDQEHMYNLVNIGHWFNLNSLAILRDIPEHSFLYPPTIVNAVYTPNQNSIEILAGILQPPFYAHNSLAALNYGGVGMIIGHEMTHGFDSIGCLFDKYGNLGQWWSDGTMEAFNQHALCFVNQYNQYIPPELAQLGFNIPVNGLQTLAENIADNGGIREAFQAYQVYVDRYGEEPRLPGLEEFSPEHIFYLGFANAWCEHKSPLIVLELLALDAHSPGRFRVLGPLSNDEEFSKVWNCPAGSPMNHGNDRCLLW